MGVSFCECEASLSAPFSYMETSIACVEKIILEGRVNYILLVCFIKLFRNYIVYYNVWIYENLKCFFYDFLWFFFYRYAICLIKLFWKSTN